MLHKYETRDYSDRPVDSERWADCLIKAGFRRRQYLVSPWTVFTDQGWSNIEDVAVIAAIDGSGKWMLAPQTKEERRALAMKRDKENRARRYSEAEHKQELLNKRGQEAEVMIASLAMQPKSARPRAASPQFSTASHSQRPTATSSDLSRRAGSNGKNRRPSVQY